MNVFFPKKETFFRADETHTCLTDFFRLLCPAQSLLYVLNSLEKLNFIEREQSIPRVKK